MLLLGPVVEQGELPLRGIEAHQRVHNRLLHSDWVRRITSSKLATLHPRGRALPPEREFALGFGKLRSKGNHRGLSPSGPVPMEARAEEGWRRERVDEETSSWQ